MDRSKPGASRLEWLSGTLTHVRSIAVSLGLFLALFVLFVVVWRELYRNPAVIEPIDGPEELARRGLGKDELARLLRDHVSAAVGAAQVGQAARQVSSGPQPGDITVPGTGLSVRAAIGTVTTALGIAETRISGTLSFVGAPPEGRYRLSLRSSSAQPELIFEGNGTLDEVMRRGAYAVLAEVDPYSAGEFTLSDPQAGREQTTAIIHRLLARGAGAEGLGGVAGPLWARYLGRDLDGARAYFLWGSLERKGKNYDGAIARFERADAEYGRVRRWSRGWAAARDAVGLAHQEAGRLDRALEAYQHALEADPDYVSALVHIGDVHRAQGRLCTALPLYERSAGIDPLYAMAWKSWGESASQLRKNPSQCGTGLARHADHDPEILFARAIGASPGWADPWLQTGIYQFEQKRYPEAIEKLEQARTRAGYNAYVWWRLGWAYLEHSGAGHRPSLRKAVAALCKAAELDPNNADVVAVRKWAFDLAAERSESYLRCPEPF